MTPGYGVTGRGGQARGWPCGGQPHPALLGRADRARVMCMSEISRLLILIGSVRDGRFGPVVASWVADRAREHGAFEVDVMDLAEVEIPSPCPPSRPRWPPERTRARPAWPTSRPAWMPPTRSSWSLPSTTTATPHRSRLPSTGISPSGRPSRLRSSATAEPQAAVTRCSTWRTCSPSCTPSRSAKGSPSPATGQISRTPAARPAGTGVRQGRARAARLVGHGTAQGPLRVRLPRLNGHGQDHRIRPRRHRHRRPRPHRRLLPARLRRPGHLRDGSHASPPAHGHPRPGRRKLAQHHRGGSRHDRRGPRQARRPRPHRPLRHRGRLRTSLDDMRQRLTAAGADVGQVQRLGDSWSLFFRDPDGMELEICTPIERS